MASNREERFLQRQRGAGIHKIKDIEFGLAFPAASDAPLRPSRRRTPQSEQQPLPPQRSSRRTPKPSEQLPSQRSTRRTPTTARNQLPERPSPYDIPRTEDKERLSSSQATQSDSQGNVSEKRRITGLASARRLSTIAQTALLETPDASTSALQSPRKPLEGPATTARGEHEVANEAEAGAADPIRDQGRRDRLLVIANAPGKRKSEGKSLTLRSTPIVPAQKLAERAEPVVRSESQPEEQEPDSASNKQQQAVKPRRRKRTSIGKIPKKRKQSIVTTREGEIEEEEPEEEALPAQERVLAMPRRAQTLLKRALATVEEGNHEEDEEQQAEEDHEEDHEEDNEHEKAATKFLKHYSRPPKPRGVTDQSVRRRSRTSNKHFNGRRGGTVDADTAVAEELEIPSTRRKNRESVPITVHRLSTVGKGEDEGNVLIGPPPFPKRNGVNAVDVLGQVCRELIANAVEKLQQDAEKQRIEAGKGEWKRKRKAVMAFGAELDSRLFDMSEALDNNWALSMRVKQANKEKIALREELLRVRREREKVALQTDQVRRVHEEASKASQDQNILNTALYDLELAVERGRTQQQAAQTDSNGADNNKNVRLELLLQRLAANVSSSNGGGGLLSQVKEFNAYLERTATFLESRA